MVETVQEIVPALEDLCDESASHNGSAEFGLPLLPGSIRQRGCHTCVEEWNPRGVAHVKNPGIGFIRKSRAGRVDLAADPPTPDGMLEGAVRSVSADVLRLENEAKFLDGGEGEREISLFKVLASVEDRKRNRKSKSFARRRRYVGACGDPAGAENRDGVCVVAGQKCGE